MTTQPIGEVLAEMVAEALSRGGGAPPTKQEEGREPTAVAELVEAAKAAERDLSVEDGHRFGRPSITTTRLRDALARMEQAQ